MKEQTRRDDAAVVGANTELALSLERGACHRLNMWRTVGGPSIADDATGPALAKASTASGNARAKFAVDLYGAFPVKRLFWVVLTVFSSERERPFFVPSPAIRSPERAEGVKGPKR